MEKFTFIDLFSGIGGFRMALEANGGHCIGFSEINKDAIQAYYDNYKDSFFETAFGDIRKIKGLPSCDLLVAGVPCQSWSIAGKNLGFDDDRGQLWNDTIYLLNQSQPKAFIFENVKGLTDPRNRKALDYIMKRIKSCGYYADYHILNSADFGVMQNRVRVYIIGFKDESNYERFKIKNKYTSKETTISEIFNHKQTINEIERIQVVEEPQMSLSVTNGFNDYFLFNDLRNGHSTIHSWDIYDTTKREKEICLTLLKNRRKQKYGHLDGNSLSLEHFKELIPDISKTEIDKLVKLEILRPKKYLFKVLKDSKHPIEQLVLSKASNQIINIDSLKIDRELRVNRVNINQIMMDLENKEIIKCFEVRYDFKNSKISTGINGVSRIFLPSSKVFPTLVASDTNDYIATVDITAENKEEFKKNFIKEVWEKKKYRKITKEEACTLQGFPKDFILPGNRTRWMKLIGNSVSVPVINTLVKSILATQVFNESHIKIVDSELQEFH